MLLASISLRYRVLIPQHGSFGESRLHMQYVCYTFQGLRSLNYALLVLLCVDLDTVVQPVIRRVSKDVVVKMEDDVEEDNAKRVNRHADVRNNSRGTNVDEPAHDPSNDGSVATAAARPFGHPSLGVREPIIAGISRMPEIIDGAGNATKVDNGSDADQLNAAALALQGAMMC